MGIFKRSPADADETLQDSTSPEAFSESDNKEREADHTEAKTATGISRRFKLNKAGEGDAALALFSRPEEVDEPVDPAEEKRVVRKIDFMILPVRTSGNIDVASD